jgi:hypothetical protein
LSSSIRISTLKKGLDPIERKLWRQNDIPLYDRCVLWSIVTRLGNNDHAFPSQQRIADDLGISIRQVNKSIANLSERGFVTKERRYAGGVLNYYVNAEALLDWSKDETSACEDAEDPYAPEPEAYAQDAYPSAHGAVTLPIDKESNKKSVGRPKSTGLVMLTEEQVAGFKADFPDLDVDEEIANARDHKNHEKWKTEYRYTLNWLKNARKFSSPKFSSNGNQQQVKPTQSRDDWGMTPEQWREAILAAGGELD